MPKINNAALDAADKKLIERYSSRLQKFGCDPRTLGWDTQANQYARFKIASNLINFQDRKILDIGCGPARILDYLPDWLWTCRL